MASQRQDRFRSSPFRDATEAADHDAVCHLLADDVELHSPILSQPFVGREAVCALLATARESFDDICHPRQMSDGEDEFLSFEGHVRGTAIEGAILIKFTGSGLIRDLTVFIRPLRATAAFAAAVGPALAISRRHAWYLRMGSPSFRAFAALTDGISSRSIALR